MPPVQSQNQFGMGAIKGQVDLRMGGNVISCQVDATSAGLVAGQMVKMMDSVNGIPLVVESAAITDDHFGVVVYDQRKAQFVAGDVLEIAFFRGTVIYLESSAAIARNAKVSAVIAGQLVQTAVTGNMIIGRALDKATAANQYIRVLLDLPGTLAP